MLPSGWYPDSAEKTAGFLSNIPLPTTRQSGWACIVPHAGWSFSGKLAAQGIGLLGESDVILLAGGHLKPGDELLMLDCGGFETPLGTIQADASLFKFIRKELAPLESAAPDNTTEVLLPIIRYFHPDTPIAVLRVPPGVTAERVGKAVTMYGMENKRRVGFVGSTDLTHYGSDYGFTPRGTGPEAFEWVRSVNDKSFINAALLYDWEEMIHVGVNNHAACSSGAAAAAAVFAAAQGAVHAELLTYATSRDIMPGESMVGYASILYS